ncbi:MAG: group II intron reverse transcriptase/maturase [Candidatus Competibacteraceae bacterium]|jgi:RNA-directed DNA polymerase|nr:group II intron reverse transcriptase/maturase [Candidatus Competibacteraceae bacterium]
MSGLLATYEWGRLPWRKLEMAVFKLQKRIYKASQAGDTRRVHQLQRLLLKSRAAKLLAVRQVTQDNRGKHTAGVDGVKSLTPKQRLTTAAQLEALPTGKPARRIWIPKPGKTEQRPLSIPTLYDRARQALVKQVLEPEWEAKFEPNSYGFRPGRSVHDAIGAIFNAIRQQPKYVLDADIAKCFDRIDQNALLGKMNTFPSLQRLIKRWLKAGIIDKGRFTETARGTQQGSVLSPLLANISLHGLETHIRNQFPIQRRMQEAGKERFVSWKPLVIRYADDIVVLHRDQTAIEHCRRLMEDWLAGMGLELSPEKTRLVHTLQTDSGEAGFNFLGFQVRQYSASKYNTARGCGFKTLIKPGKEAIKGHYRQLAEMISRNQANHQENLIGLLNSRITGWSNYYRAVVSKDIFTTLDYKLHNRLTRWARFRHPKKSCHWIVNRYWTIDQGNGWVFTARNGWALKRHAGVPIIRHVKVRDRASPYDGNWSYWAARRGRYPGVSNRMAKILHRQHGRCEACGLVFMPEAIIEIHHLDSDRGNNRYDNLSAVHRHCHDQIHGGYHELSQRLGTYDKSPVH